MRKKHASLDAVRYHHLDIIHNSHSVELFDAMCVCLAGSTGLKITPRRSWGWAHDCRQGQIDSDHWNGSTDYARVTSNAAENFRGRTLIERTVTMTQVAFYTNQGENIGRVSLREEASATLLQQRSLINHLLCLFFSAALLDIFVVKTGAH